MLSHHIVGEDEVIRLNMESALKTDYTSADIDNLPEDKRAELIDGQIYFFAAPSMKHQLVSGQLSFELKSVIKQKNCGCRIFDAPVDVYLDKDDKTRVEPDIIGICNRDKLHEDACYGAPDLVIEITSRSTRKRDYGIKTMKYRCAGVREYWIIDMEKEMVLTYWFENEQENCLYSFKDEITFHLFPELTITIQSLLNSPG